MANPTAAFELGTRRDWRRTMTRWNRTSAAFRRARAEDRCRATPSGRDPWRQSAAPNRQSELTEQCLREPRPRCSRPLDIRALESTECNPRCRRVESRAVATRTTSHSGWFPITAHPDPGYSDESLWRLRDPCSRHRSGPPPFDRRCRGVERCP